MRELPKGEGEKKLAILYEFTIDRTDFQLFLSFRVLSVFLIWVGRRGEIIIKLLLYFRGRHC